MGCENDWDLFQDVTLVRLVSLGKLAAPSAQSYVKKIVPMKQLTSIYKDCFE